MDMKLRDKVVVVTGGAGDIGAETSLEFLREGCKVAVCSRSQKSLDKFREKVSAEGFSVLTGVVNVRSQENLDQFAKKTADTYGGD